MRIKLAVSMFLICATSICNVACAQEIGEEQQLNFVTASAISAKIKAKFADSLMFSLGHILVDTDDHGFVVLSGHARNREQVEKAMSIARQTDGVTLVWNHIRIAVD